MCMGNNPIEVSREEAYIILEKLWQLHSHAMDESHFADATECLTLIEAIEDRLLG